MGSIDLPQNTQKPKTPKTTPKTTQNYHKTPEIYLSKIKKMLIILLFYCFWSKFVLEKCFKSIYDRNST